MAKKAKAPKNGLTKEQAGYFLRTVSDDTAFWVANGPVFRNLEDMANGLQTLDDAQFAFHVNNDKNDFYNWINDIIGDKNLCVAIKDTKAKEAMQKKVAARVAQLKKAL